MSWFDNFWMVVRDYRQYLGLILLSMLFMLVLTSLTLLVGNVGSASYTLATLNVGLILGFGAVVAAIYWYSLQRHPEP